MASSVPPRRPRSPRGLGQLVRAELIDVATRQIADLGSADLLTLRGVGREVGIAAASIYHHFATLDDLIEAVLDRAWITLASFVRAAAEGEEEPVKRLSAFTVAYIRWAVENPAMYRVIFSRGLALPASTEGSAEADRLLNDLAHCLEDCLPPGQGFELAGSPVEPSMAAQATWVALHGATSLILDKPGFDVTDAAAIIADELAHRTRRDGDDFAKLNLLAFAPLNFD